MKLFYGLALIVLIATVAESLYLLRHKHEALAQVPAIKLAQREIAPTVTQLHRSPAIAPTALVMPPDVGQWSPWVNEDISMTAEGQARSRRMARKAYDVFVSLGHLSTKQREEFDGTMREFNRQFGELSLRVLKEDGGREMFSDGMEQLERDAYRRMREILRPEQWEVFTREIGKSLGFVATYLRD